MTKHKLKSKKSSKAVRNKRPGLGKRGWHATLRFAMAAFISLSAVGVGLAAFKHNYDIEHDLSVIGKGIPAVVQIHNPSCQLCQRLRKNAIVAMKGLDDRLLYRVADITTPRGQRLQRRHDVPHVTLLLFDGQGELRKVIEGVKGETSLHRLFLAHVEKWGS